MYRKVFVVGLGTEYDWRIDEEVKLSGEWWITESGERGDDDAVDIVVSQAVTRRGLEQATKESKL